jgi:putative peptidoglycan lipid II flippase
MGRLYSSASFALGDTRTPFRFATVRVAVAAVLGAALATQLPARLGLPTQLGVGFLTAGSGVAAWLEYHLLRRYVESRIGRVDLPAVLLWKIWLATVLAALVGRVVAWQVGSLAPLFEGVLVLGSFGGAYVLFTQLLRVSRARSA